MHKSEINKKQDRNGSRAFNPSCSSFVHLNSREREFTLRLLVEQTHQCLKTRLESWNPNPNFRFWLFPAPCLALGRFHALLSSGTQSWTRIGLHRDGSGKSSCRTTKAPGWGRGVGSLRNVPSKVGYSMILSPRPQFGICQAHTRRTSGNESGMSRELRPAQGKGLGQEAGRGAGKLGKALGGSSQRKGGSRGTSLTGGCSQGQVRIDPREQELG